MPVPAVRPLLRFSPANELPTTVAGERSAPTAPPGIARLPPTLYLGWALLAILLIGELVVLTLPFHVEADLKSAPGWVQLLIYLQESLRPAFASGAAAALFLSRNVIRAEWQRATATPHRVISIRWLGAHLVLLGLLASGSLLRHDGRVTSLIAWEGWLFAWVLIAVAALCTWCVAAMPPRFWINWLRRSPLALAAGAVVGLSAIFVGDFLEGLWWVLERPTFEMVALILRLAGERVVAIPQELIIGTPDFSVSIGAACSGLEGIGLVTVLMGAYLWYRRSALIFPRALLMIPLGIFAIWLANAARIAALVLIGQFDGDAAVKGFHSVAGWLLFNVVACGLIWATWRGGLFAVDRERDAGSSSAAAYLLPMLVLLFFAMVARAFAAQLAAIYLCGVFAAGFIFWTYRSKLPELSGSFSRLAVGTGTVIAAIWFGWSRGLALSDSLLLGPRAMLPAVPSWIWIGIVGGMFVVPIVEELAFRGYLARRLLDADVTTVAATRFSWMALLVPSIAYGLLHSAWIPASLAGIAYGALTFRRGRLADAVVAHVTTCIVLLGLTLTLTGISGG